MRAIKSFNDCLDIAHYQPMTSQTKLSDALKRKISGQKQKSDLEDKKFQVRTTLTYEEKISFLYVWKPL